MIARRSLLATPLATSALAQPAWTPSRPLRIVVPFPAGGSFDVQARLLAEGLAPELGQPVVVENRPGAGGNVGTEYVAHQPPDGYTILVSSLGPYVIAPHLLKTPGYDALKDFDFITVAVQAPNVLTVPAASPFKSLADVIAFLKAHPGKMSFASAGNGSSDHLTAELFWQTTGTSGLHVPYKGGAPAMTDLLGGQVDATFMNINTGLANIRAGKLRALAIVHPTRSPLFPSLPTIVEAGFPGYHFTAWFGIVAPSSVPRPIITALKKSPEGVSIELFDGVEHKGVLLSSPKLVAPAMKITNAIIFDFETGQYKLFSKAHQTALKTY
jgi:tripartite-type tricarboxylate transporter receptor subunit TctC